MSLDDLKEALFAVLDRQMATSERRCVKSQRTRTLLLDVRVVRDSGVLDGGERALIRDVPSTNSYALRAGRAGSPTIIPTRARLGA